MTTSFAPPPTAEEAERRYRAWAIGFTRRAGIDRDRLPDVARDAAKLVWLPPLTISETVEFLEIPGSTPVARRMKLRRLERAGSIPKARRSLLRRVRFWLPEELVELRAARAA